MNTEAPAGKNPVHHSGKLYNILANRISYKISKTYNCNVIVNIAARNGDLLHKPHRVYIKMDRKDIDKLKVRKVVAGYFTEANFRRLTQSIINSDPIKEHSFKSLIFQRI